MKTVLGLDLGTQSLKAVCYDYSNKQVVAVSTAPLALDRDQQGKAEQLAQWWLDALATCCAQLPTGVKQSIQAIAVSGQQHGFVPLAANGSVLAPVKLWCDTATQAQVNELTTRIGGSEQAIALTGNPILAGYTAPKIRWLRQHRRSSYDQLAHILLPHDYLNFVLTGALAMEYGDASGTGLLDVRMRCWSKTMLQALDDERDLSPCLPPLLTAQAIVGTVTIEAAQRYGLPAGIPVATGGGDNMMSAIGTGNVKAGELTVSLGTSGTLFAYAEQPIIDPQGHIAAFCSSNGGWLPLLCTLNCTSATELMRELLAVELKDLDSLCANIAPGCDGLVSVPFFSGERTPNLPQGKGCLIGLDAHNSSKAHLLRATLEAVSFSLYFGYQQFQRLGLQANELTLTGGGSNSHLWRQLLADLFQLPVRVLQGEQGAAFGAALQALWVLQRQQNPTLSLVDVCNEHLQVDHSKCVNPDPSKAAVYATAYQRYQRVVQQVAPLFAS